MKKATSIVLLIFLVFVFQGALSQNASQIAYVNSDQLLEVMPEKAKASKEVNELNNNYKKELEVMQNDYNMKYSDFMTYQTSMAENIRLRRIQELYELERHITEFMKVAQQDVLDREKTLLDPIRVKIKEAIYKVGVEGGYVCVYDLANPSILFVTPDAVDITEQVKAVLAIK